MMKEKEWDMKDMKCIMCEDGFMIKSKDEKEVMDMARIHIKSKHKVDATEEELREKMAECKKEMDEW